MSFVLQIYDNFHYRDESEAHSGGVFESFREAKLAAEQIVEASLRDLYTPDLSELLSRYQTFGDDPVIKTTGESYFEESFSGRNYAKEAVFGIWREKTDLQTIYQATIRFAAEKHLGQTLPASDLPYLLHISNVAMEIALAEKTVATFDTKLAIQLALLHDTLEDTQTSETELSETFGRTVAEGVWALTKDATLPKADQMADSLQKIRRAGAEASAVKMADRITNLQAPPSSWSAAKIQQYRAEAQIILEELGASHPSLAHRLGEKIAAYTGVSRVCQGDGVNVT